MSQLYIVLVHNSIMQRGVNTHMTKQALYLFNGHTFVNSHCGKGTAELMGMNLWHRKRLPQFPYSHFYTANG